MIVYNQENDGTWLRAPISLASFGSPEHLVFAPLTASDSIPDNSVSLAGQASLVTPLVYDVSLPTAELIVPFSGSQISLGTTQSAVSSFGQIIVQFSEAMVAASSTAAGSASNPASYKVYNYGLNGVDENGQGDDRVFTI